MSKIITIAGPRSGSYLNTIIDMINYWEPGTEIRLACKDSIDANSYAIGLRKELPELRIAPKVFETLLKKSFYVEILK